MSAPGRPKHEQAPERAGLPAPLDLRYCSHCGSDRLEFRVPDGDSLPRYICASCGSIHYQNPKVVVGCLPVWNDQVLLCKRAIEPRLGLWTLPAGFLENGESVVAGAVRETLEEADARVDVQDLHTLISLPQIHQVYMMFRARLLDLDFGPGPESLEVRLFDEAQVPWDAIAFRTIARTLRNFFLDRKRGTGGPHISSIERRLPLPPDLRGAA